MHVFLAFKRVETLPQPRSMCTDTTMFRNNGQFCEYNEDTGHTTPIVESSPRSLVSWKKFRTHLSPNQEVSSQHNWASPLEGETCVWGQERDSIHIRGKPHEEGIQHRVGDMRRTWITRWGAGTVTLPVTLGQYVQATSRCEVHGGKFYVGL